jgi:uncharacterized protein (DUF2237 family)
VAEPIDLKTHHSRIVAALCGDRWLICGHKWQVVSRIGCQKELIYQQGDSKLIISSQGDLVIPLSLVF